MSYNWQLKGNNPDDLAGVADTDNTGYSVSLSSDGNTVAIGEINYDSTGKTNNGRVRVFAWNSSTSAWEIKGSNPDDLAGVASADYTGRSVSLSSDGNTVAIGELNYDSIGKSNNGRVRVFAWNSSTSAWELKGNNADALAGVANTEYTGVSVSLSSDGNTVAIGEYYYDSTGKINNGRVRVFAWNSSTSAWELKGSNPDALAGVVNSDYTGRSVSLSSDGNTVAIGETNYDSIDKTDNGRVRVFSWNSSTSAWELKGNNADVLAGVANTDYTGISVSLSSDGNTVAIGEANYDSIGKNNNGRVRVFNYSRLSATELKAAGYTATQLKTTGYTASELKDALFTASELKAAGFAASELSVAGFTASELKAAGFTATQLKAAGYNTYNLSQAGFTIADMKDVGFTIVEMADNFSLSELKDSGLYTLSEFKDNYTYFFGQFSDNYSFSELKAAGFTNTQLFEQSFTIQDFINNGIDNIVELFNSGFSLLELRLAGYTPKQIVDSGLNEASLTTLIQAGFIEVSPLKEAGFTANELKVAGFNASELKDALFTASELKDALFTASELKTVGFTKQELLDGGYNKSELIALGFTFELNHTELKSLSHYASPISAKFTHSREDLSVVVNIENNKYTKSSGVAYCQNTGYIGVVTKFSVTATNTTNSQNETNFSSEPINAELTLPMANINASPLKLYKVNPNFVNNPKIITNDYPVSGRDVTYNSTTGKWETTLPSLSTFIVVDPSAPSSGAGGDPHVQTIHGEHHLLPNDWKLVKLYEHNDMKVIVKCEHINDEVIEQLHKFDERRNIISINKNIHKYVTNLTYMTELFLLKHNEEVFKIDLLNDKVLLHNEEAVVLEKLNSENEEGLFSLTHKRVYPKQNLSSYLLHLDSNNVMKIQIDNFWDDINFVKLHLFDSENIEEYVGEFFKHDEENKLE